jgi:hypothetical protein
MAAACQCANWFRRMGVTLPFGCQGRSIRSGGPVEHRALVVELVAGENRRRRRSTMLPVIQCETGSRALSIHRSKADLRTAGDYQTSQVTTDKDPGELPWILL